MERDARRGLRGLQAAWQGLSLFPLSFGASDYPEVGDRKFTDWLAGLLWEQEELIREQTQYWHAPPTLRCSPEMFRRLIEALTPDRRYTGPLDYHAVMFRGFHVRVDHDLRPLQIIVSIRVRKPVMDRPRARPFYNENDLITTTTDTFTLRDVWEDIVVLCDGFDTWETLDSGPDLD